MRRVFGFKMSRNAEGRSFHTNELQGLCSSPDIVTVIKPQRCKMRIVLMGWLLLPNALRPIQDLLCSPEFKYY